LVAPTETGGIVIRRIALLLVLLTVNTASAASPAPAPPDVPAAVTPSTTTDAVCSGAVRGAVQADFTCTVTVAKAASGVVNFEVKATAPVKGLKTLVPATFAIKGPVVVQTYAHRDLVSGRSSAVTTDGKKFSATENLGDRGDLEIQVRSMEMTLNRFPLGVVHVHAHLVPKDAKDKAEIQLDVDFEATW
jgi:hypothetical protein